MNEQEAQRLAAKFFNGLPSPHAPGLTNGDYPTAVKLATRIKFGGHASPTEATNFWTEFKGLNQRLQAAKKPPLSPEQFGHVADDLAKVSFRFHGRPPTMHEIERLHDQMPKASHDYYHDLPDQHYPEVSSGNIIKALETAKPWANQHLGRDPVKSEAAYLHHSGEVAGVYYERLSQEKEDTWQSNSQTTSQPTASSPQTKPQDTSQP